MMTQRLTDSQSFAQLSTTIPDQSDYELALKYAPRIQFDTREPFLPSAVGYTVFRETNASPSFPREINIKAGIACAIEYAVWWDWDMGHLYELEHIWVYIDTDGNISNGEASWHGGYHRMINENAELPIQDGRLTVHSEPGKHAFAPSPAWLHDRKTNTLASCGKHSGKMGVHVTPLFEGIIQSRNPLNNRLVHTYLERLQFEPGYDFSLQFNLEQATFVPWEQLFQWIPKRIQWWTEHLRETIPPSERRGLRIAHRGASAHAQENSADSLQKAAELGSDMVEIDIRSTTDDVPIVSHDESLKRLYGIDVNIGDVTFAELRELTKDSPVMSFEETVKMCSSLGMGLYLDIKNLSWKAAESVFESLDKHHAIRSSVFGSFRPDYLAEIKAHRPDAQTSILFNSTHIDPVALAQSINADYVHPCWENRAEEPHKLLTPEWIQAVRDVELGIVCWHEERPAEIAALQALGVDAICSDQPELLVR